MGSALIAPAAIALCAFTLALLWAELSQNARFKFIFKPLASMAFIALALACGALGSNYGLWILAGLILCAAGDSLLLPGGTGPWFRRGVMAFMAGHIAYAIAALGLWAPGALDDRQMMALPLLALVFIRMYQRLRGRKGDWLIEVYTVVILVMIAGAIIAGGKTGLWLPTMAAIMFATSDIFVSRNRHGPSSPRQFWIITPLYFGAQGLFAISILYA